MEFRVRAPIDNDALNRLHAAAFEHPPTTHDWRAQVEAHSITWITAHEGDDLVGFVNMAWDGGAHAFLLDPVVAPARQRMGIGRELRTHVIAETRKQRGLQWIHVDSDAELMERYYYPAGFRPTNAGIMPV